MSAALDYAIGGEQAYTGLPGDATDTEQMAPYVNTGGGQMRWWEGLIAYGVTRAIDNRLGPVNVAGNTGAGTFGGQNGRTYGNQPSAAGGGVAGVGGLPGWAVLAGVGLLAYLAVKA